VAPWTFSVQPTCTPKVEPCEDLCRAGRSTDCCRPFALPVSPCAAAALRPTQQILELRDQGLTWSEVAKQVVDMTVSGAWSRYRKARPQSPHGWAAGSCIGVRIGTRHVKHAGTVGRCETVGGSSCSGELSPGGVSGMS
jgi:hypothetical protein